MYTANPARTDPPTWRIIAAFLVVPGAAALLLAILQPGYNGISDPIERTWRTAVIYAVFGAYPATIILGLPAFFVLRRRFEAKPINCSLTGAIVAGLPFLIISMLSVPDSASINGRATVVDGSRTTYGWIADLTFVGQIALLGAVAGALFWLIAAAGSKAGKKE